MRNPFSNSPSSYNSSNKKQKTSNNEEWPEIIEAAMNIFGRRQQINLRPASPKPTRSLDLQQVTADDLETIKTQDPFMYYSIPEVRSARMQMREIDMKSVREATVRRNGSSRPSRLETATVDQQDEEIKSSAKVSRRTSISYECHPDMLFEDWLDGDDDFDLTDLLDDDEGQLLDGVGFDSDSLKLLLALQ